MDWYYYLCLLPITLLAIGFGIIIIITKNKNDNLLNINFILSNQLQTYKRLAEFYENEKENKKKADKLIKDIDDLIIDYFGYDKDTLVN